MRSKMMALGVAGVMAVGATARAVIILDTFETNPGDLQGRLVEVPQVAGNQWSRDNTPAVNAQVTGGKLVMKNAAGTGFTKAAAPFSRAGITDPYILTLDLTIFATTDTNLSFWTGFGNSAGDGATFGDFQGGPMFRFAGDLTGLSFTLVAGNGPFPSTSVSTVLTRPDVDSDYVAQLGIVVDPAAATNNVEFFVNGGSIGKITYTGNIGGLWTKADGLALNAGLSLDNVQVAIVPEPSGLVVLAAPLMALVRRRR